MVNGGAQYIDGQPWQNCNHKEKPFFVCSQKHVALQQFTQCSLKSELIMIYTNQIQH